MIKLATVKSFSPSQFVDRYWLSTFICGQVAGASLLFFYAVFFLLPVAIWNLQKVTLFGLIVGTFWLAMTGFLCLLAARLVATAILQLIILRGLKTRQYARTKFLCIRAIDLLNKWPMTKTEVPFFQISLGVICMSHADYTQAEDLFAAAADCYKKYELRLNDLHRSRLTAPTVICLSHLACALAAQDKFIEADRAAQEALVLARTVAPRKYARLQIFALYACGSSHLFAGDLEQSEAEYTQVLTLFAENNTMPIYGNSSFEPCVLASILGLAIITVKQNRIEQSLHFWQQYRQRVQQVATPLSANSLRALNMLANEYLNNRLFDQAQSVLDFSYNLAMHHFDHPDASQTLNHYEKLLHLTDRHDDVANMRAWLHLPQVER